MFFETTAPAAPARRLIEDAGFLSHREALDLVWNEYKVLAGLPAMGLPVDFGKYFTLEEMNALWACENLGHYLRRTATTISTEPAQIASMLLMNLINSTGEVVDGKVDADVQLRRDADASFVADAAERVLLYDQLFRYRGVALA